MVIYVHFCVCVCVCVCVCLIQALPVLWFYQYAASVMVRAVRETVYAKILRLQNFTNIPIFSLAIRQLNELLIGGGLPQEVTHMQRPPEANWVRKRLLV